MWPTIRQLTEFDRLAPERHFLAVGPADRRLRFAIVLSDRAVRASVERIDVLCDAVFGATDEDLGIVAAAHLAHNGYDGELGVPVLPQYRQHGELRLGC